ncbi:MAG TPA: SBBP repeat-containing protein [Pirellulales bacterium]|nr:SBBP repeat-containing protein [Pirellulales bacterium]
MLRLIAILSLLAAPNFGSAAVQTLPTYSLDWVQQFGTSDWDQAFGVSADNTGNVYVTGETAGSLESLNAGLYDGYFATFDNHGTALQTTQFGSPGNDVGTSVSADGLGNVFVGSYTQSPLGGPNNGGYRGQLFDLAPDGTQQWRRFIGPAPTYAYGVSADGQGNAYVAGYTAATLNEANAGGYDAFVTKYNSSSNALWTHQFGTPTQDQAYGVASDGVNSVYVTGSTLGSLGGANAGGYDAFLTKYDASGNVQWTQQLGSTGNDIAQGVSADHSGRVYVVGNTSGLLGGGTNFGLSDAFISNYNSAGALQWTKQFGTSGNDFANGVATDARGNIFVVGATQGSLGGPSAGGYDAFLSEFNVSGQLLWTQQFGTDGDDMATAVSVNGIGEVFVTGNTTGSLGGPNAGSYDVWLARFSLPVIKGDFNRDGVVDSSDIVAMLSALNNLPNYETSKDLSASDLISLGDFNGDNQVNNADLQGFLNFLLSGGASVQSVPEPAGFVLLALGGLLIAEAAKRRKLSVPKISASAKN